MNCTQTSNLEGIISVNNKNSDIFYKNICDIITIEEREYIKSLIIKSCNNCANMSCRVENYDKPVSDCFGWENNVEVGKYKVLKLNK